MMCGISGASAQTPLVLSNWSIISSFKTVRDAAVAADGSIWVATTGGVFVTNPSGEVIKEFRSIETLQSLDVTTIAVDQQSGTVIMGGESGALNLLRPDGTWTSITDIRRATQYPRRGIRDIVSYQGFVYLATDFGVVVFDASRDVFVETIDRIGSLQEKTRANGLVIAQDSIWVATDSGVAVAPLAVPTLRLPSAWQILDTANGTGAMTIPFIAEHEGRIAIATDREVRQWQNGSWSLVFGTPSPVNGLTYYNGVLRASTLDGLWTSEGQLNIPWPGSMLGHTTASINGTTFIIGFIYEQAVALFDGSTVTPVVVNTPLSNQFARMTLDRNGDLWVATDVDPPRSGQGVAHRIQGQWRNYTAANTPAFVLNAAYRIQAFPDGTVYVGTWGGGAVLGTLEPTGVRFEQLTSTNSAFQGIASSPTYVLAADAAMDRLGTLWIINEQAAQQVLVQVKNGQSRGYSNCFNSSDNLYRSLAVDLAGNKWIGGFNNQGLLVFNEQGTVDGADDLCQAVRSSNTQLPDNTITSLRVDRTGQLWVGTSKGVAVIASPTSVTKSSIPFVRRISALTSVVVNDIYVDALNYKWIATTNGVFVLNEDGTDVLATITPSTAPLADANVRSVVVDDRTGVAYFGTSYGCSVATTSSIAPATTFELSVFPQPFQPQRDGDVVIDGLAADTDLRIMTVSGNLVQALTTRGRQATWDGRDASGRYVPPGVYIIHATSALDQSSAVCKIIVTR